MIDLGVIWVCQCCMLSHANGECCDSTEHGGDSREPWAIIDGLRFEVYMGMGMAFPEHSEYCEREESGECDCERDTFATRQCEGCGSRLAGERHAFTLYRTRQRFVKPALV